MRNKQGLYVGVANELSIAAETLFCPDSYLNYSFTLAHCELTTYIAIGHVEKLLFLV
jgi:hypothetical protein